MDTVISVLKELVNAVEDQNAHLNQEQTFIHQLGKDKTCHSQYKKRPIAALYVSTSRSSLQFCLLHLFELQMPQTALAFP